MTKIPTVAIVIPAYNEEASIRKCLESCLDQTSPADEIIVVDNNSTDTTVAIVEAMQKEFPKSHIRLVREPVQGIAVTRNRGFKEAKSDVLGRIDSDSRISPEWVAVVRELFADRAVAAATGPVVYHDMPLSDVGLKVDEKVRDTLQKLAKDHRFLFGSNMAIRASAWNKISHLTHDNDPTHELHEDIDIALTLFENNLEVVYSAKMIGGMSARRLEDSPRDFYRYIMRFERTFKVHDVHSAAARIPIFIYLLIYFPLRTIRKFYDGDTNQFTLQKLRDELSRDRS